MKSSFNPEQEVGQIQTRGPYERLTTDTAWLAGELASAQNLDSVVKDFDRGYTLLRDVGRMFALQRDMILDAFYRDAVQPGILISRVKEYPIAFSAPVANLHRRITEGPSDQPIGHNFFENALRFIDANRKWATQLDDLIQQRSLNNQSFHFIAESKNIAGKDAILKAITDNPDTQLMAAVAVYLAGRSLEGENYLKKEYGKILEQTKAQAFKTTQLVGLTTNLHHEQLERSANQFQRTTFGSFDHLNGLITFDDSGTLGDYQHGTLRIEVHFEGSVRNPRLPSEAKAQHTIAHELQHAGSAQYEGRCGLQVNGQGLAVNEGMTEYLAQLSLTNPNFEQISSDSLLLQSDTPYLSVVLAMQELHRQFQQTRNNHFAILFNAYHGDVTNREQLEQSLDAFYRISLAVAQRIGR